MFPSSLFYFQKHNLIALGFVVVFLTALPDHALLKDVGIHALAQARLCQVL